MCFAFLSCRVLSSSRRNLFLSTDNSAVRISGGVSICTQNLWSKDKRAAARNLGPKLANLGELDSPRIVRQASPS